MCGSNLDCHYSTTCQSGVCTPINGNPGTKCLFTSQCATNQYCASNFCVLKHRAGGYCSINDQCGFGSFCYDDPATSLSLCRKGFTLPNGAEITQDQVARFPCESGAIKNIGGKFYCMPGDTMETSTTTEWDRGQECFFEAYLDINSPFAPVVKKKSAGCGYNRNGKAYCN